MSKHTLLAVFIFTWLITSVFSEILCSTIQRSWQQAMEFCIKANGVPMNFDGLTGQNIESLHIQSNDFVWTSDYFQTVRPDSYQSTTALCSFYRLNRERFFDKPVQLFCDCSEFRLYFCKNGTDIAVFNNTWNKILACGNFLFQTVPDYFIPGNYWSGNEAIKGVIRQAQSFQTIPSPDSGYLCGAFSVDAGRHFRDCNSNRTSLCIPKEEILNSAHYDDSCFTANTLTTYLKISMNAATVNARIILPNEHTSTAVTKQDGNSSKLHVNETDTKSEIDIGQLVGIVVGICVVFGGAIGLLIYIQRRYKYLFAAISTGSKSKLNINDQRKTAQNSGAHTYVNYVCNDTDQINLHEKQANESNQADSGERKCINDMDDNSYMYLDVDKAKFVRLPENNAFVDIRGADVEDKQLYSRIQTTGISQDEYDTTGVFRKTIIAPENIYNQMNVSDTYNSIYNTAMQKGNSKETRGVCNTITNVRCRFENSTDNEVGFCATEDVEYNSVGEVVNINGRTDNVYNTVA